MRKLLIWACQICSWRIVRSHAAVDQIESWRSHSQHLTHSVEARESSMRNLRLNRNSEETIMTFSITSHRLGRRRDYVGRRHYINTTKINGASSTKHHAIEIANNKPSRVMTNGLCGPPRPSLTLIKADTAGRRLRPDKCPASGAPEACFQPTSIPF
jgi:hypothetical protein